ncbi:hypothetical protein [Clostridium saccharobutylicum]
MNVFRKLKHLVAFFGIDS